ncbi:hypothetical protein ACJX0J_014814, partial [Zea mays]
VVGHGFYLGDMYIINLNFNWDPIQINEFTTSLSNMGKKRGDDWNRSDLNLSNIQINEFHGGAGQGIFIQNTTTLTIPNAILAQYHGVIKNPIALSPQFIT